MEHWVCAACRRATRLRGLRIIALERAYDHGLRTVPAGFLRTCRYLLGAAAGKRRIPRCLQPA